MLKALSHSHDYLQRLYNPDLNRVTLLTSGLQTLGSDRGKSGESKATKAKGKGKAPAGLKDSDSDDLSDVPPAKVEDGPLLKNKWWRVILDEVRDTK